MVTTTDTDALKERIARVLDPWVWTDEDDDPNTFRRLARRNNRQAERPASLARAAAVLPIVAAEVRKAKAEALRAWASGVESQLDATADKGIDLGEWGRGLRSGIQQARDTADQYETRRQR